MLDKINNKNDIMSMLGNFKKVDCDYFGVKNQAVIYFANGEIFQSYGSWIVVKIYGTRGLILGNKGNYSKTTGKYRNIYLNETKKETEAKIKNGNYKIII